MSKIYNCAFHTQEFILNFCKSHTCMLPLCPTCIKIHTEEHNQKKTYGDFEGLNVLINQIEYKLKSLHTIVEDTSEQFQLKFQKLKKYEMYLKKIVVQNTSKMLQQFKMVIEQLQNSLLNSLRMYYFAKQQQFDKINEELKSLQENLREKIQDISTEKCLKEVITSLKNNQIVQLEQNTRKLQQKIKEFQQNTLTVQIKNELASSISREIINLINLTQQKMVKKQNLDREKSFYSSYQVQQN